MSQNRVLSSSEREFLFKLVRQAGDFALSHWPGGEERRPFHVKVKSNGSPVTSVDIAVNEMLQGELTQCFPRYGLYSEELPISEDISEAEAVWVLDPIDGTQNFIDGNREFGVLLGLVVPSGEVVFAIAYFPALEMFFWAAKGEGAFCNEKRLKITSPKTLEPGSIYVRNGGIEKAELIYEKELGTAHGFYFLLTGEVDALTIRITQHQEWDICPLVLLVKESGALITDESGAEVVFHFAPLHIRYLVAAHHSIHSDLLALLE